MMVMMMIDCYDGVDHKYDYDDDILFRMYVSIKQIFLSF